MDNDEYKEKLIKDFMSNLFVYWITQSEFNSDGIEQELRSLVTKVIFNEQTDIGIGEP